MTETELLAAFTDEIRNLPRVALVLTPPNREEDALALSPETLWCLIGQIQLALRHPANIGMAKEKAEAFLEWVRMVLVPPGSAQEAVFLKGFEG